MAKRLTENQKKTITDSFKDGETIENLSKEFKCTNSTIIRNLKKDLGETIYKELAKKIKNSYQNNLYENSNIENYEKDLRLEISKNNLQNLATDNTRKTRGLLASFAQMAVKNTLR